MSPSLPLIGCFTDSLAGCFRCLELGQLEALVRYLLRLRFLSELTAACLDCACRRRRRCSRRCSRPFGRFCGCCSCHYGCHISCDPCRSRCSRRDCSRLRVPNGPFGWPHSRLGRGRYFYPDPPFSLWGYRPPEKGGPNNESPSTKPAMGPSKGSIWDP